MLRHTLHRNTWGNLLVIFATGVTGLKQERCQEISAASWQLAASSALQPLMYEVAALSTGIFWPDADQCRVGGHHIDHHVARKSVASQATLGNGTKKVNAMSTSSAGDLKTSKTQCTAWPAPRAHPCSKHLVETWLMCRSHSLASQR